MNVVTVYWLDASLALGHNIDVSPHKGDLYVPADVMVQNPPFCAAKLSPFRSGKSADLHSGRLLSLEQIFDGA